MQKALLFTGLVVAMGGATGFVTMRTKSAIPPAPVCASCTAPIYQQGAVQSIFYVPSVAEASACLNEIEITEAGPYDVVVTQDGSPVTGWSLTADSAAVQGHRFAPLAYIPSAGNEELQIRDADGGVLALAYLHIPRAIAGGAAHSATFLAVDPTAPPGTPAPGEIPPGYSGSTGNTAQSAGERTFEDPTMQSEDVPALGNVQPANEMTIEGQTYYEMPLRRPDQQSEVPAGLKVYLRKPGLQKKPVVGKKCPPRKDGQPCQLPGKNCSEPQYIPMDMPSVATVTEMGVSVTYFKQPFKKVVYCNVYRCVNNQLVFVRSEKCVSTGGRAWGFDPVTIGSSLVGILLGYGSDGYRWDINDPCVPI